MNLSAVDVRMKFERKDDKRILTCTSHRQFSGYFDILQVLYFQFSEGYLCPYISAEKKLKISVSITNNNGQHFI